MATTTEEDGRRRRYPVRARKVVKNDYIAKIANKSKSWKPKEIDSLLSSLNKYGDQDVVLLSSKIETKAPNLVYTFLQKHKDYVEERSAELGLKAEKSSSHQRLEAWIEHLKEKKPKYALPNPAALSILLVSLLEDHPVSTDGEVNFPEAYQYMFELFSGRHASRLESAGKVSGPTLQFIKLSVLSLMKDAMKDMETFHNKLLQSTGDVEPPSDQQLPIYVQRLSTLEQYNPLGLNVNALSGDLSENI